MAAEPLLASGCGIDRLQIEAALAGRASEVKADVLGNSSIPAGFRCRLASQKVVTSHARSNQFTDDMRSQDVAYAVPRIKRIIAFLERKKDAIETKSKLRGNWFAIQIEEPEFQATTRQ